MPNFFFAEALYADGHTEYFEECLWYLGGGKNQKGHDKLAELRHLKDEGIIVQLDIDYES